MILEVAILNVKPGQEEEFERDFAAASRYISGIGGYVSHELLRCLEKGNRFILLVRWTTLEAHTEGFRKSPQYQDWKRMLHHYYDPFPIVEHYSAVYPPNGPAQPSN
jgi:heme-degrading monooxygenase HmoA